MMMYGMLPEYGKAYKPWQKAHKTPLCHHYEDKHTEDACILMVSMRFLRIASGLKGKYTLHKYYRRINY